MRPHCFGVIPITTPIKRVSDYGDDPDHFHHVWEHLFKPAIELAGFEPWAPWAPGAQIIPAKVCHALQTADMALTDLSGLNPNVLYELGIRTALNLPVTLVCDSAPTTIPSDLANVTCHRYNPGLNPWRLPREIHTLADHILATARACNGHNDYWQHHAQPRTNDPKAKQPPGRNNPHNPPRQPPTPPGSGFIKYNRFP
jgi:hypothetical protein